MSVLPPFLQPGDKLAIAAPARKTTLSELETFIRMAAEHDIEVVTAPGLFESEHQFAGSDAHRATVFQFCLDNPEIKAIISAKGGYGTARVIDKIRFDALHTHPKWLIGFSDFTVIHNHLNGYLNMPTLHASMPAYLKPDSAPEIILSFERLFQALKGAPLSYNLPDHPLNKPGNCSGKLVGGNLSVIYSVMGSVSEINTTDAILFLEDLDEYLYHVDRMMVCLKRAGKLQTLRGVIIGHMNSMHDNPIPFGKSAEEIMLAHTSDLNIPLYFGFPAGHLNPNMPLIFGTQVEIENNCLNFGHSKA